MTHPESAGSATQTHRRRKASPLGNEIWISLRCTRCDARLDGASMVGACGECGGSLEYHFDGSWNGKCLERGDLWKNFDLLPLMNPENIVSCGEGGSQIIELQELSDVLAGARLFLMLDSQKNPTGTFKDREASIIISRCKELGLDDLVFYSTGNTGRAYTHYAAQVGLTTYFFMPVQCRYKNTGFAKNENNHVILVDSHYPDIGPYAKEFAKQNGFNAIAPLHERTECYTTLAYEQFQGLPEADFFVQTIASGMGPIGFLRGHRNLVRFGLETADRIPRIVCVQSEQTNSMYTAFNAGKTEMTRADLPAEFPDDLFEPTLNSTNPVNNYPSLRECLSESNGIITDASPEAATRAGQRFVEALGRRGIELRVDLEKSALIGWAGVVRLAEEGRFEKGDRILMLATGRGATGSNEPVPVDLTIDPSRDDPVEVRRRLGA